MPGQCAQHPQKRIKQGKEKILVEVEKNKLVEVKKTSCSRCRRKHRPVETAAKSIVAVGMGRKSRRIGVPPATSLVGWPQGAEV